MLPLTVLRPEPGWSATAAAARALGLEVAGAPLFEVVPVAWDAPDDIDALLLGSANAVRHAGPTLAALTGKPAYAVGEVTAAAARDAGFAEVIVGSSDLAGLSSSIDPGHRRLLRLAGHEHTPLPPLPGHEVLLRIVYAAEARPLGAISASAIVALHSARAAVHFARECDRLGLSRASLSLAALSPQVAKAAGDGWARIDVATTPTDAALLALAAEMCKAAPGFAQRQE